MTLDERPIKNVLRGAVDIYLYAMRPFIVRCLSQAEGKSIEDTIRDSINRGQIAQFDRALSEGRGVEDSIDIGHFGHLVSRNWNEVFYSGFNGDRRVQGHMGNIKHLRNRLAHPSQQDIEQEVEPEYARKCLVEIADMLSRINRPDEKQWVEAISYRLFSSTVPTGVAVQAAEGRENEKSEEFASRPAETPVTYWVYEDKPTNRTRIHKAACRFCNDGRGLHGSRLPDNRWIGPLESVEVAMEVAQDTERKDIAECKACRPLQ